ncbi:P-loop containing nucleoside triphosphate hydrolase protein [Aspergillus floccosus]
MQAVESVRVQSQIDRRTCRRVKPMKVLVLGLCRTGTLSTWLALQELGYDTYHMTSIMQNPQDAVMWKEAFQGKYYGGKKFTREDWDQLLGHVEAITDFPGAVFVEELTEAYPDAKVVLTLRDVDDWIGSMRKTIMKQACSPLATLMGWIDPVCFGEGNRMCRLGFNGLFMGDFERNGRQAFLDHYDHVRRVVPADNLLEWSPKEGWEPLCKFLEQPIPSTPFPRSNEAAIFQQKSATVIRDAFTRFFKKVTILGVGATAAFFIVKYARKGFFSNSLRGF